MKIINVITLSSLSILSASAAQAEIVWNKTAAHLKLYEGAAEADVELLFRNTGHEPITILDVSASCTCTSASDFKQTVAPGETGAIRLKYNGGDRVGSFSPSIKVETSEKTSTLALNVDIIDWAKISTRLLVWKSGEIAAPQAIEITLPESTKSSVHVPSVTGATATVKQLSDGKFIVSLVPIAGTPKSSLTIPINIISGNRRVSKDVFLVVR